MPHPNYSQYVQFLVQYASITLIYYDFILTFEREVKYIWMRPRSWAMLLVVCCRYSLIANVVFALGLVEKLDGKGCDYAYIIASSLSMLGRFGILTILGARTCAVFQHNRYVVTFFLLLGLSVMGLSIAHVPYVSCSGKGRKPPKPAPSDILSIMTVVYELLSTLFLTYGCIVSARNTTTTGKFSLNRKGLAFFIFREGLLYTSFVSLFTTSAMILVYTTPAGSFAQRSLNALTLPISGMMCVRFLLHLRQWQKVGSPTSEFSATTFRAGAGTGTVPSQMMFADGKPEENGQGTTMDANELDEMGGIRSGGRGVRTGYAWEAGPEEKASSGSEGTVVVEARNQARRGDVEIGTAL